MKRNQMKHNQQMLQYMRNKANIMDEFKRISPAQIGKFIPVPNKCANKYSRGTLAIIGGSASYPGAACLAACAAQRAGAGYTQVWCAPESVSDVRVGHPSLVVRPWNDASMFDVLQKLCGRMEQRNATLVQHHLSALLIGCGFSGLDASVRAGEGGNDVRAGACESGKDARVCAGESGSNDVRAGAVERGGAETVSGKTSTTSEFDLFKRAILLMMPLVVDGGAISFLAQFAQEQGLDLLRRRAGAGLPLILTPHAGEAARLARAANVPPCENDELAEKLSSAYSATVVLKGPQTFIYGAGQGFLMDHGSAALAKAGSGDVLAGIVAAFVAQGVSPVQACCLATSLHAHAGNIAAKDYSSVSVIPEDLIAALPSAIKDYLALAQS